MSTIFCAHLLHEKKCASSIIFFQFHIMAYPGKDTLLAFQTDYTGLVLLLATFSMPDVVCHCECMQIALGVCGWVMGREAREGEVHTDEKEGSSSSQNIEKKKYNLICCQYVILYLYSSSQVHRQPWI